MSNSEVVYTGYGNRKLWVSCSKKGKYFINGNDKVFIAYYVGYKRYNTSQEALARLNELKEKHALYRFDR